jgi:epoxyqueuosine reductase
LLRNAAIVLGNQTPPAAIPALLRGLADEEPLVRGACGWALGNFGTPLARAGLAAAAKCEKDSGVLQELSLALARQRKVGHETTLE